MLADAFCQVLSGMRGKKPHYVENVRWYHKEFSHPSDQNLCTLALTWVPSYKTAFMTTHDYLEHNI
jgi:hypothetical protein